MSCIECFCSALFDDSKPLLFFCFFIPDWQRPAFPTEHTAPHSCLSARTTYAFSLIGNVTETMTVEMIQTRSSTSAVRSNTNSQKRSTLKTKAWLTVLAHYVLVKVLNSGCEVLLRHYVHPQWTSSVKLRSVSAVTTTAASTATSCVTPPMTVVMALMRNRTTVSFKVCS